MIRRRACFAMILIAMAVLGRVATAQQISAPTGADLEMFRQGVDIGDVILIVDFSGSMKQIVDGRPKYVAAGDAAQELLNELAKPAPELPVQSIGLMLYGHRSGNCSDIELAVPPGPVTNPAQRDRIMRVVRATKPHGMTPISASLAQAAEKLQYRDRPATVVLISDGLETCHQDPCAQAKRLRDEGVHFVADVVGYDVNPEEFNKLKCIADVTGGVATRATNAGELGRALRDLARNIVDDAVHRATGQLEITVVDVAGGEISPDAFEQPPTIVVTGARDERRMVLAGKIKLSLLSGAYHVRLEGPGAVAEERADVVPQRAAAVTLKVADGILSAVFRPSPGAEPFASAATTWRVVSAAGAATSATTNPASIDLIPGRYRAEASFGPFKASTETQLRPGLNTAIDLSPQLAALSVSMEQPNPDFFAGVQTPRRFRVEADTPAGPYEFGRSSDEITVQVPPGSVRLPWTTGADSGVEVVEVPSEGMRHVIRLSLPSVAWILDWIGEDVSDPIEWKIEALLDGKTTGAQEVRTGPSVTGTMPVGDYQVTVTRGRVETTKTVTVPVRGVSHETFMLKAPF